jgi:DNA-directed RNA polymerase specialized sigma24 family protein
MRDDGRMERMESTFRLACSGDPDAFARWMQMVEIPLWRSLSRFARTVEVEVVVQETFMRMWVFANDPGRVLEGESASLRFAFSVARNVAREEVRRCGQGRFAELEELDRLPEGCVNPELPDPALGKAIGECVERLPKKPRKALVARIGEGHLPDRELAQTLRMKLNTFLQNIVRARKLLAGCLERKGVRLGEFLS